MTGSGSTARDRRRIAALPLIVLALCAACRAVPDDGTAADEPATVEKIGDTGRALVTLTGDAAERIGLETSLIGTTGRDTVVPESAIWIDVHGTEWVYTEREPFVFVRARVIVDRYESPVAVLSKAPPVGTAVVSVGVPELVGAEFGI